MDLGILTAQCRPPGVTSRPLALAIALALSLAACGAGEPTHAGHGVVTTVSPEHYQVVIDHDAIPGVMDAMEMNFTVRDAALLASLQPGDVIDFELQKQGNGYAVVSAVKRGEVQASDGWAKLGGVWSPTDPAPEIVGTDQHGAPFSLAALRGRVLLVDFIFTRCPGPCPIQTGIHVDVLKRVPPEVASQLQLISVSLDPEYDTPERLTQYARDHGADSPRWTFVTGEPAALAQAVKGFGIGTSPKADGEVEHLIASFALDRHGRIARRYLGDAQNAERMAADLIELASAAQ